MLPRFVETAHRFKTTFFGVKSERAAERRQIVAPGVSQGYASQTNESPAGATAVGNLSPLRGLIGQTPLLPQLTPGATVCRRYAASESCVGAKG